MASEITESSYPGVMPRSQLFYLFELFFFSLIEFIEWWFIDQVDLHPEVCMQLTSSYSCSDLGNKSKARWRIITLGTMRKIFKFTQFKPTTLFD